MEDITERFIDFCLDSEQFVFQPSKVSSRFFDGNGIMKIPVSKGIIELAVAPANQLLSCTATCKSEMRFIGFFFIPEKKFYLIDNVESMFLLDVGDSDEFPIQHKSLPSHDMLVLLSARVTKELLKTLTPESFIVDEKNSDCRYRLISSAFFSENPYKAELKVADFGIDGADSYIIRNVFQAQAIELYLTDREAWLNKAVECVFSNARMIDCLSTILQRKINIEEAIRSIKVDKNHPWNTFYRIVSAIKGKQTVTIEVELFGEEITSKMDVSAFLNEEFWQGNVTMWVLPAAERKKILKKFGINTFVLPLESIQVISYRGTRIYSK